MKQVAKTGGVVKRDVVAGRLDSATGGRVFFTEGNEGNEGGEGFPSASPKASVLLRPGWGSRRLKD